MSKLKAFVRYDGTNRIVPGGPILQRSKPKNGVWEEIGTNDCCDDFVVINNKKLRAFVRIDGKHNVVAGSLILLEKKPKVGKWVQIPTSNCCINLGSYCYVVTALTGESSVKWIDSTGAQQTGIISVFDPQFADLKLCAQKDSVVVKPQGKGTYSLTGGTSVCTAYYSDCVTCNCYEASTPNGRDIISVAYRDCSGIVQSVAPGDSIITCINEIITYGDGNAIALGSSCKLDAPCSDLTICYQMYNLFTCTVTYIDSNGLTQEAGNYETVCAKINSVSSAGDCLVPGNVALFSKVYDAVNNSYLPCEGCGCQPLRLEWVDINNVPVTDPYSVADWNDFFALPTNGTPFTAVDVIGNTVYLYGGGNMTIRNSLFVGLPLVSISDGKVDIDDNVICPGIVINIAQSAFNECHTLETVSLPSALSTNAFSFSNCENLNDIFLPSLQYVGIACFEDCVSLSEIDLPSVITVGQGAFANVGFIFGGTINLPLATTIGSIAFSSSIAGGNFTLNIPSCTALGPTVGNDSVFINISLCAIALTIPVALMTCNSGSPDGDIQYLVANNTVTITTV